MPRIARQIWLALLLVTLAAPVTVFAAPKYISDYDVRRHLREDCRKIVRKAKFYVSARCTFKLLAVDRGGPVSPPGFSRRPSDYSLALDSSSSTAIAGVDPDRSENYSPSLDVDLTRIEQRLAANRARTRARVDDITNPDSTPRKGKWSHMRALVVAKGFVRDVTFEVTWRLKWTPSNRYTRTVLRVIPAKNPARSFSPGTGQTSTRATTTPRAPSSVSDSNKTN